MNLNERINRFNPAEYPGHYEVSANEIKQLIRDVLEYVKPDRAPIREEDDLARGINIGMNVAVDDMEEKAKELGV